MPANPLYAIAAAGLIGLACAALTLAGSWLAAHLPCANCRRTMKTGCGCFEEPVEQ